MRDRAVDAARGPARSAWAWALRTRLRASSARVGIALCYHALADTDGDPSTELDPAVSASTFGHHVRHLARCYRVVPASQLAPATEARRRWQRLPVAITFDDDLRSHVTTAMPALQRARVPATFFLCGAGRDHWWQRLQRGWKDGRIGADTLRAWGADETDSLREVAGRLQALPPDERRAVDAELRRIVEDGDACLADDEIAALAANGFEIGFHTLRHDDLVALDDAALHEAMHAGRTELERRAGRIVTLAYPHGRADARVAAAARAAGFEFAFVADGTAVGPGESPHLLGRRYPARGPRSRFALDVARTLAAGHRCERA